jgi:3-hydroxyisobutyrate dehydrogenase-like beta-hydroxyacid dehydrogenase
MSGAIARIGIVGLGKMGLPIARHLLAKGYRVTGFDVSSEALDAASKLGAKPAASPKAVAAASDLVLILVGFEDEVEETIFAETGLLAGAAPGLVIAVASTVAPTAMADFAARLGDGDIALIDAPLCRGEGAARDGTLLVMVGGAEPVFQRCRPAFAAFAEEIFHLGALGAGQVGKMVNNLILWACMSANDEGLRLGEALGVDPERLREALHHGSAQNWAMDTQAERSGMPWAEKDMSLVLHEADVARLSLPLCGTVKETIKGLKIRLGLGMPEAPGPANG